MKKKAFDLYKKGAKEDCIQAQVKEACCYIYGKGIEKDEEKGVKMIENLAEESKHPYAKETLASLYIFGVEGLIEKDYKKALTILEECKEEPYGLYLLGELYFNNEGYEIDYPKAMEFFNKAYELGDRYSANLLGYMYQYGKGVSPNIQEAISWYTKAANMRGNTQAMMNLANIYYENDS
ncbi:tetratricopeptide repeat protein [Bacteroides thetaiotaomicron]